MPTDTHTEKHTDMQTGYPSIDKPWLKYYRENAEDEANNIPVGKTVWDVIEKSLYRYSDIPAIEYFGRTISRKEFIDEVYCWAKVFKALGVKENEVIPYYGPFMPDICAMIFALNIIGACPYFLKLAISPEALAEETKDCRTAIVFDQMWENVSAEFSKDRFKTVVIAKITDAMPTPKKQIITLLSSLKKNTKIPREKKYLSLQKAKKLANEYEGNIRAAFVANRSAFITSSSGTTLDGVVKGIIATNEMALTLLQFGIASDIPFAVGDRVLNNFPPTAATSIHALLFTPMLRGGTIIMDPRVSEKDFYNQLVNQKPNIVLITGSAWEAFFMRIESEIKKGKSFDFSCATYWIVGGEGTDIEKYKKWNSIVKQCHGKAVYSGYGQSELFSATCVESPIARYDTVSKSIMSVGIPYAGITVGVFDEKGNELKYNHRGELRIKSQSAMKGYYGKPELTARTKVDGWIKTGDIAEIDEKGFVYIWGRADDKVKLSDQSEIYLFDIANKIKENDCIIDAMVIPMPSNECEYYLAAHIVWSDDYETEKKRDFLEHINNQLKDYLPEGISISAFADHKSMLPYSPTTLKKDKNKMAKQTEGYIQVYEGIMKSIKFIPTGNGSYHISTK